MDDVDTSITDRLNETEICIASIINFNRHWQQLQEN